eukprot:PhF_6_TR1323/c0_g1_i1/m.2365
MGCKTSKNGSEPKRDAVPTGVCCSFLQGMCTSAPSCPWTHTDVGGLCQFGSACSLHANARKETSQAEKSFEERAADVRICRPQISLMPSTEQQEIEARCRNRREQLRHYHNRCVVSEMSLSEFQQAVAICVRAVRDTLLLGDKKNPLRMPPVSAENFFDTPDASYTVPITQWLLQLPSLCRELLPPSYSLQYDDSHVASFVRDCSAVLASLEHELQGNTVHAPPHFTDESRRHLTEAIRELYTNRVHPDTVAEEWTAVVLYTLELQAGENVITHHEVHGWNPSLYGVMNWVSRMFRDVDRAEKLTCTDGDALLATVQLFLPLLARIDVHLSRLPVNRRTLYRGMNFVTPASKYKVGSLIPWTQLSSTSRNFDKAAEFGTGTLFVALVHNAATIDFLSHYREEEECLLPSYTWVRSVGVMSPTLLRLLGSTSTCITVQAVGDSPTPAEVLEGLLNCQTRTRFILKDFLKQYIPARLHPSPLPQPADTHCEILFQFIDEFLSRGSNQHLVLVGPGGTGKTCAALATHCHLSSKTLKVGTASRPVVSVFIPLPSISPLQKHQDLDNALCIALGVEPQFMDDLLDNACVVAMLDSLDECDQDVRKLYPLLDNTLYFDRVRVVLSTRSEAIVTVDSWCLTAKPGACVFRYVQPFTSSNVKEYLKKTAPKGTSLSDLESIGIVDELQRFPVTLRMGVEILQHNQDTGRTPLRTLQDNSSAFGVPHLRHGTRSYLYRLYMLSRLSLRGKKSTNLEVVVPTTRVPAFLCSLQRVALKMLAAGCWTMPLQYVLKELQGSLTISEQEAVRLLQHVPMRLESLDPTAEFSFWHRSIAEFLSAYSFWGENTLSSVNLTCTNIPFSLREPNVLSYFNECATSDFARRDVVCGQILMKALQGTRNCTAKTTQATLASNCMALIGVSEYPLYNEDLTNLYISQCHLFEANFSHAALNGTTFEMCDLNRAQFNYSNVERTRFVDCTFGPLRAPMKLDGRGRDMFGLSNDNQLIVTLTDQCIQVWDIARGVEVKKIQTSSNKDSACAIISADNKHFITASCKDKCIRVWDLSCGVKSKTIDVGHPCMGVALSRNSTFLASGGDNFVRIWDFNRGSLIKIMKGHLGCVTTVAISPDNTFVVSGSADKSIRLWDVNRGVEVKKLEGHMRDVRSVTISADNKMLVSGSEDSSVILWDIKLGAQLKVVGNHSNTVSSVAISSVFVVSGGWDNTVRVWDLATGNLVHLLEGHQFWVKKVAITSNNKHVVSVDDAHSVRLWDIFQSLQVKKTEWHTHPVVCVAISRDGTYVVSGSDNQVRVWDAQRGVAWNCQMDAHTDQVRGVAISTDNSFIASGSRDGTVRIWDLTGEELQSFWHNRAVMSVAISTNNAYVVSGTVDQVIRIWDLKAGVMVKELVGHEGKRGFCRVVMSNEIVASGGRDSTARLWDFRQGKELKKLEFGYKHNNTFELINIALSVDNKYLVTIEDTSRHVVVWNGTTGAKVKTMNAEYPIVGDLTCITISVDNNFVVSGGWDGIVRLFDVNKGTQVKRFEGHTKQINSVAISADNGIIVTGSNDQTVRIWNKDSGRSVILGRCSARYPCRGVKGRVDSSSTGDVVRFVFERNNNGDKRNDF